VTGSRRCTCDCKAQVLATSEKTLLGQDADAWATQLIDALPVELVVIRSDEVELEDLGECQVDVRHDQRRVIVDAWRPVLIPGALRARRDQLRYARAW